MTPHAADRDYDAIVIGSGFGGALAALPLVRAGWRVLMLERGGWVRRGEENWLPDGVSDLSPHYQRTTPYRLAGQRNATVGSITCVGGPSVFYGGASLRYRAADFVATPEEAAAGAAWPFGYDELEPWYAAAERLIGVAGETGSDPTEPPRSSGYPGRLPPLSRIGCRVADAAERLGLRPFRLPLAINYRAQQERARCIGCSTCDCHPCAISAKNDVATAIVPVLLAGGLELRSHTAAVRLRWSRGAVHAVDCIDLHARRRVTLRARHFILAAGALATPHLLLASGLDQVSPAPAMVGANLMRHCNAIVYGVFPRRLDAAREFHKQICINDFYFGHPALAPAGKLGAIQQIHAPPAGLVRAALPRAFAERAVGMIDHMTGLICIASDAPSARNRVALGDRFDALGMPAAEIHHAYGARDLAARKALVRVSREVLREAGALLTFTLPIRTFSHALGTVRTGQHAATAPLDAALRFRGAENLLVTDASALATSAGVNPSLTIAANALRAGALLAGGDALAFSIPQPASRARSLEVFHE